MRTRTTRLGTRMGMGDLDPPIGLVTGPLGCFCTGRRSDVIFDALCESDAVSQLSTQSVSSQWEQVRRTGGRYGIE